MLVSSQRAVKQWKTLLRGSVYLSNKSTKGTGITAVYSPNNTQVHYIQYKGTVYFKCNVKLHNLSLSSYKEIHWTVVSGHVYMRLFLFIVSNSLHHCFVWQRCPCLCDQRWSAEGNEQWRVRRGTTEPSRDGVCKDVPSAETDYCGELSASGKSTNIRTYKNTPFTWLCVSY